MTDRPIIFSAPMVRALLAGRKTQTRRLASSPLARCAPSDRLYVREAWSHTADGVFEVSSARISGRGGVIYRADDNPRWPHAKFWPSLHMPREFSRLTLVVEAVRVEPLQAISEADAQAEGCVEDSADGLPVWYTPGASLPHTATGAECYRHLWSSIHTRGGERWDDDPAVVALTFLVVRCNIDQEQP